MALISTVDYITPPVNDPYWFGQIAAANSLSDVYAMGGKPLTALNLVMYPAKKLDMAFLKDILRGGSDKVLEAGASMAGGHSVDDNEPKYGLAVTGSVHPDRILTNCGCRAGDALIVIFLRQPQHTPRWGIKKAKDEYLSKAMMTMLLEGITPLTVSKRYRREEVG